MSDIKSKPKEVKRNTHSLKTNGGYKTKKTAVTMSAADGLKRQYVKTKAELKKQTEEQNERPENYAAEAVEDRAKRAAYAAADAVRQPVQYAAGRIKQRKAQKIDVDTPVPENPAQEIAHKQLEAPRTNKPQDRQRIKARREAAVRTKERAAPIKTKETVLSESTQKNVLEQSKIKSKSEYLKSRAVSDNKVYRLKQKRVYHSKDNLIKPKTIQAVRAKQEEKRLNKDTDGNILVIHCSSSANNVVVSTAQSVGFTVFRRPNCY